MQKTMLPFLLFLWAPMAFGGYAGPVVVKTSATGFVMPEWTRIETCELYQDKIVIKRSFGTQHTVTETKPLLIEGSLLALAAAAAQEPTKEDPGMICDLPTTRVYAVKVMPDDTIAEVPLFATGACGSNSLTREGGVTQILRDMIDLYCPKTYEIHRE